MLLCLGLGASPSFAAEEPVLADPVPVLDPDDGGFWEAVTGGTVKFNLRLRAEFADQKGLRASQAYTARPRLGYQTADYHGFEAYLEFENVSALDDSRYNAAGLNGQPDKTVIADPEDTEVNQVYLGYRSDPLDAWARVGRQRIVLDDARFIGNVGWRQNEQTYDSARLTGAAGECLEYTYAYLQEVHRIFGPDANRDFDSDSHVLNLRWTMPGGAGSLTGFVYSLRFSNANNVSSDTYGVRWTGSLDLGEDLGLEGQASYAHQQDGRSSRRNYDASYVRLQADLRRKQLGSIGAGYEVLGSDSGHDSFQTPLATLHSFNGWADVFLTTPANGLEDLFVAASVELPWQVRGQVVYHWFHEQRGSNRLGSELDASLGRGFGEHLAALVKGAWFNGSSSYADIHRVWLELTATF